MLALAYVLAAAAAAPAEEPYAWPLDLPRVVTGTFGEYRGGRFHAGMDLMTGENGRPVHAPANGYVSRVTCSPWGYGRAVYLQLEDGHLVVFGHLSRFAPAIAEYVHAEQHAHERYAVELTPEAGRFPVHTGDVVAFSGDTGTVDPHLHYEIRDAHNAPINPRVCGVQWPDTTPPDIHAVLIVPGEPGATVDGDLVPAVRPVRRGENGEYVCEAVKATGRIVFGLDTIDPANNGNNKLGVYRIQTTVDGRELFAIQFDTFSYENRQNELVAYYPFLMDKGSFLLQWRWPGNVCDVFQHTNGDGLFTVPDHPADVAMESVDTNGNRAIVRFQIIPDAAGAPPAPAPGKTGQGKVEISCVNTWLVATATFTEAEPETPVLSAEGAVDGPSLPFRRIDARQFRAALVPAEGTRELAVRIEHPRMAPFEQRIAVFRRGDAERVLSAEGATVCVKPLSPYGTLFLRAFRAQEFGAPPLPVCGAPLRLWPAVMPVDQPFTLALPAPQGDAKTARVSVYRDAGSYWDCESDPGTFQAGVRTLGVYALMEDTQAPTAGAIHVSGDGPRPRVYCEVRDVGTGLGQWRLCCNDQWLLSVYDPARHTITWEQDEDLPAAPRVFALQAIDKAGNRTTASSHSPTPAPNKAPATHPPRTQGKARKHT